MAPTAARATAPKPIPSVAARLGEATVSVAGGVGDVGAGASAEAVASTATTTWSGLSPTAGVAAEPIAKTL